MNINELSHIEAIRVLKARYCRFCDERKWDELYDLFAEDAVFGVPEAAHNDIESKEAKYKAGYLVGRNAILKTFTHMAESISDAMHLVFAPEIEMTSADTAKGIWAFSDHLYFHAGPVRAAHGLGHYHETYVLLDGVWKIKTCIPVRIRIDVDLIEKDGAS